MAKIKVTQIKSAIDQSERNKKTLQALGLRKVNQSVEKEITPQIEGMVKRIHHLIKTESI